MQNCADVESWSGLEIAIIGMSGRFPGARDIAAFWQNLRDGVESIAFFSDQELAAAGVDPAIRRDPNYVKARAVLEDIELFDAAFFGVTPREAAIMDPQHRLFLECAWEAMENAGYTSEAYPGSIGVYAGTNMSNYAVHLFANRAFMQSVGTMPLVLGNDKDYLCSRVSYKLNLEGPSVAVQTSCSTSLVAVHLACQGLLSGACDMALAGGVSVSVPQQAGYLYQQGGIYSPDGHCRAFDAAAQGTVSGSGVGIVVLKRLADALTDGDSILALIKGSAINNDGASKAGYTAPRVHGQAEVIRLAQRMAEVAAESITYIEAHGTGTVLGDPIEAAALTRAFRASTAAKGFCALGSVKTNIGHLDAAAGVAGLIKTVLALHYKLLPPSLHWQQSNPQIDFANSPFYVNTMLSEWLVETPPRRAGVSSFGIGGTNAHVVLEEAPQRPPSGPSRPWQLLVLSAQTATALEAATANLVDYCKQHPHLNLADMAYTLQVGRRAWRHRRTLVCQDLAGTLEALERQEPKRVLTACQESSERPVVFMFPGQGSQYVHMGAELYHGEPLFREQVECCAALLTPHLGLDLRDVVYPNEEHAAAAAQQLTRTSITQPALFVIEYALAQLWMAWGLRPQAMIGHSIGEYVAACLAGVFSLEDALALVARRGRLMQRLPTGAMLAVALSEQEVQPLLGSTLSLAASNGPTACVIAGPTPTVTALARQLGQDGVPCRPLQTSHAFHSAMMGPIIEPFMQQIDAIDLHPPRLPYVSNVTGTWITAAEATTASYWGRHLRQTVRFAAGLHTVLQEPESLLLEVGPGKTLSTLARRHTDWLAGRSVLASLPAPREHESEVAGVLHTLGQLWLAGARVDWAAFSAQERRHRLPLPPYPFERQRYWVAPSAPTPQVEPPAAVSHQRPNMADWFYLPAWKRAVLPYQPDPAESEQRSSHWLVFVDACGVGVQVVKWLQHAGQEVTTVTTGEAFMRHSEGIYSLQPQRRSDYEALLQELHGRQKTPTTLVHCWSVTPDEPEYVAGEGFNMAQEMGVYSALALAQALGELPEPAPRRLVFVSNHMHDVTGTERLRPEKATLLGCCRVLPQEYPHMTCRSVDIELATAETWQAERLVEQLTAEVRADVDDPVVAYRGPHRWVQTFEPLRLDSTATRPWRLRDRGVYLITGGLGGIGLLLAEYLARTVQAKLVLTGRQGLPPRAEWEQLLAAAESQDSQEQTARQAAAPAPGIDFVLEREADTMAQTAEKIARELDIKGLQHYEGLEDALNALCTSYLHQYLKDNGIDTKAGSIYGKAALKTHLKIMPPFEKFYEFMINVLLEDKVIDVFDENIHFLSDSIAPPETLQKDLADRYGAFTGLFRLLAHCAQHYSVALRGDIEAISVLYPAGSTDLLREAARQTVEHDNSRVYLLLLQAIMAKVIEDSAHKTLRILEIGGGTGKLTRAIIPGLEHTNVEYYFTDIGTSFVIRAEQEAAKHGLHCMQFGTLDISRSPAEQGYTPHSFDMIVGLDVVHATRSIEETIGHVKDLLAPNGLLCLVETVKRQRWIDMIWALTEGWWCFTDTHIRQDSPVLPLHTWEEVLGTQGFQSVRAFPQTALQRAATDYGLIVAQQPAEVLPPGAPPGRHVGRPGGELRVQEKIRKIRELEQSGAEVLVLSVDVANPLHMQAVLRQTRQHFGAIHGVIHTAAVAGGGLIHLKTPEMLQHEFAPKVQGALVLAALCQREQLDFLALCSSLSSITGGVGQVGYSAANAFLDALAHYNTSRNGHYTMSINWDRWRGVGLAVDVEARHRALKGDEADPGGMTPAEGVEAFHRLLSQPALPQVVVSVQDFQVSLAQSRAVRVAPTLPAVAPGRPATALHPRPPLEQAYVAPRSAIEQSLTDIWQDVFGIGPIGIHDAFFELGGESLIALQILNRLRTAFQVELSLRRFFEAPSVAGLAEAIAQERGASATVVAPAIVPLSREAHRSKRLL